MNVILFDKTYKLETMFTGNYHASYCFSIKNILFEFYFDRALCELSIWNDSGDISIDEDDVDINAYVPLFKTTIDFHDNIDITQYVLEIVIKLSVKYNLELVDPSYAILIQEFMEKLSTYSLVTLVTEIRNWIVSNSNIGAKIYSTNTFYYSDEEKEKALRILKDLELVNEADNLPFERVLSNKVPDNLTISECNSILYGVKMTNSKYNDKNVTKFCRLVEDVMFEYKRIILRKQQANTDKLLKIALIVFVPITIAMIHIAILLILRK